MSEKTMSTSKERDFSDNSFKKGIIIKNINNNYLKKLEKSDDNIFNYSNNDLLNENIKLSPMINPVPCFTVKNDNSQKDDITPQNTFYSNLNKRMNINISFNSKEEDKKEKTKILNKNLKKAINNNINNNRYFRQFSPDYELNPNQINSYNNKNKYINNKINYEIFLSSKKKLINNINKKKINNSKNIITGIKKHKFLNHLYFSTDNFYESNLLEEKIAEKKEQKKEKIKLLGQKINIATMKIEILQNYKKNKNINTIKKKIEYNKIYCNNDLKRLKDNYYSNINFHLNQIVYMKIKLLKFQESYINIEQHNEEIKKEELNFKINKLELIAKILFLKKKLNDLDSKKTDINNETHLLDDSFEEKTINDVSFNDFNNLRETMLMGSNLGNLNIINDKNIAENKIIKMNKHQINFFKAKFFQNGKEGK